MKPIIECDDPDCGCHGTLRPGFICPKYAAINHVCPFHPKPSFSNGLRLTRAEFWHGLEEFFRTLSVSCMNRMFATGFTPVYHEGTNEVCYYKDTRNEQRD